MKKILYIAMAVLLCSSCFRVNLTPRDHSASRVGLSQIKGEGPVISRNLELSDFDAIQVIGQADILFAQADTFNVTLRTQENIFDYVDFKVKGTTLVIETKNHRSINAEEYTLTLSAPELKGIDIAGAARFEIADGLVSDEDLDISVAGAGQLNLTGLQVNSLDVDIAGAAKADLSGIRVKSLDVDIAGTGKINISGEAEDATMDIAGVGSIDARNLKITNPMQKHVSGIGKIRI